MTSFATTAGSRPKPSGSRARRLNYAARRHRPVARRLGGRRPLPRAALSKSDRAIAKENRRLSAELSKLKAGADRWHARRQREWVVARGARQARTPGPRRGEAQGTVLPDFALSRGQRPEQMPREPSRADRLSQPKWRRQPAEPLLRRSHVGAGRMQDSLPLSPTSWRRHGPPETGTTTEATGSLARSSSPRARRMRRGSRGRRRGA